MEIWQRCNGGHVKAFSKNDCIHTAALVPHTLQKAAAYQLFH